MFKYYKERIQGLERPLKRKLHENIHVAIDCDPENLVKEQESHLESTLSQ